MTFYFFPETIMLLIGLTGCALGAFKLRLVSRAGTAIGLIAVSAACIVLVYSKTSFGGGAVFVQDPLQIIGRVLILLSTGFLFLIYFHYFNKQYAVPGLSVALILIASSAWMIASGADDIILYFVCFNVAGLSTAVLTSLGERGSAARHSALALFKYFGSISALLVFGAVLLYTAYGTTDCSVLEHMTGEGRTTVSILATVGLVFVITGLAGIYGLFPFYYWLPNTAHSLPVPVIDYLMIVPRIATMIFLMRLFVLNHIFFDASIYILIAVLAVVTMTSAQVTMYAQTNIRLLILYASFVHGAYMMVGLVSGFPNGIEAGILYMIIFVFSFLGISSIMALLNTETEDVFNIAWAGMARKQMVVGLGFMVIIASLAAVPLTGGFVGIFFLCTTALTAQYRWLVIAVLGTVFIGIVMYAKMIKTAFFYEPVSQKPVTLQPNRILIMGICAGMLVLLGIFPEPFLSLISYLISWYR
ncbi:MAG: hypothetical protein GF384_06200 [Elusimicrobia bacterium]|nr:hypothetical protein [Elusimicrobiota bacterium]MBD3412317.1 hypothetical protein [Elusimicrobiota bacterium]